MAGRAMPEPPQPSRWWGRARRDPGVVARTAGLVAGVVALAAGGVAAGFELERRLISRVRSLPGAGEAQPFFSLRADGPTVTTPDGVRLHVEVDELPADASQDLTVVLVHGWALTLDCWHFQRAFFRPQARVVAYDQRSHGRSGRSAPELCRIPQLARDLAQVLEEVVGDRPTVLIGHSMGGMSIMHLARLHPEWFGTRIVGVGLCATSAGDLAEHSLVRGIPGRSFSRITPTLLTALNRIPHVVERSRRAGSDVAWVITKRMAFGRSDVPASYVEFMADMLEEIPLSVIEDYYPAFAEVDESASFAVLSGVESAVIGGRSDTITPVEHTETIIEQLPGAESLVLDHSGHMGIIEHHREYNEVLGGMVERARRHLPSE